MGSPGMVGAAALVQTLLMQGSIEVRSGFITFLVSPFPAPDRNLQPHFLVFLLHAACGCFSTGLEAKGIFGGEEVTVLGALGANGSKHCS